MKPQDSPKLPRGWSRYIKTSLLHAIALAATALTGAWGRTAAGRSSISRLEVKLDRANTEIAILREELAIKDARWSRLPSRRRPYYSPVERLRVLQLKAARGWSRQQAAHAFLINEQTLRSWLIRVDEQGERALIQTADPVNKFPDFVRYLVKQLKALLPTMGKVRRAQLLARAGLHLGATTIARIWKETEPLPGDVCAGAPEIDAVTTCVVTAKHPGHTWHLDLTTVPTWSGFWVPWMPFAVPQSWPFCWWVAVAVDHFSRAVVGFAVFFKRPTSSEVQRFLDRAIHRTGRPPKYVITDKGTQFWCKSFKRARVSDRASVPSASSEVSPLSNGSCAR
jgi:transposase-like protein